MANFTGKNLRKEDYMNLYKDFDTLMKIDDIGDLELADFNGWEFDLEKYQRALNHELMANFDDALKLYVELGVHADIDRVKSLKRELYTEIAPGAKSHVLHNCNDVFPK